MSAARTRGSFVVFGTWLLLACGAVLLAPAAHAAACLSNATGNWNDPNTWASCGGAYPQSGDTATIRNAHTVTVNGTFTVAGVTISSAAANNTTSRLAVDTGNLTVAGSVTISGGVGNRNSEFRISTGNATVAGDISFSGATALLTFTGSGLLSIQGSLGTGGSFTPSTGTVAYTGSAAQTVANYGYYNLTIGKSTGSTATLAANATIAGNLSVSGGTFDLSTYTANRSAQGGTITVVDGATLKIGGTNGFPSNYAAHTLGTTSTVEYAGTTQTVSNESYGNLTLSGSGNKNLPNTVMTVAGDLTIGGTATANTGAAVTINGQLVINAGATFNGNSYTHNLKGSLSNNGTLSPGTSTFNLNGTAVQTITGATTFYILTIGNAAGVTANSALTLSGNLAINSGAVFNAGSSNHNVKGNFNNSGTFNYDTGTVTFNGTTVQGLTGATTFYNLVFNNSSGFTLNSDVTASNALTLTSGAVTTGSNTLVFSPATSCTVARTSGYVNGQLRKSFTVSQLTCDFEIGDATNYTPVNVSLSSVTDPPGGTITAKATSGDHPQIGSSSLDSANSINRYWMLTPGGGLTFGGATLTFTPVGGSPVDHDNTANVGSYITQRYEISGGACDPADAGYTGAGSWNTTTATGTQTTTSIAATGIGTFGSICSHFAHGRGTISNFSREPEWIYQRELYY